MKNKNILVIVFEVLVITLGILGITYAASVVINNRASTLLVADKYNVDYVGDTEINVSGLQPISDELVNIDTRDNVIRIEFSLRGVRENGDEKLIYDVMMKEMNIDCSLLNKYTKWRLYKDGELLSNGSLDPAWDENVLGESMRLTDIQEDLPKYNEEYDKYTLIFWISEACNDLTTCELVDQSDILNSNISMKVFIALYSGGKKRFERVGSDSLICVNRPLLYENMVAVTYKDGEFVVADKTNSDKDNLWYDYVNKKWANAVVVKSNHEYNVGDKISEGDVLGYFVWIPRFRYKLWNVSGEVKDSYSAYDNGIKIVFENGISSVKDSKIVNNNFLTHPAFGDNLSGFWISKYELSKVNGEYKFISNTESYYGDTWENYQSISASIGNKYMLGSDVNSHVVTNLEWGAVSYLSHSIYGMCDKNGCNGIEVNDSYISGANKRDTTTKNVYGVYDMAGAASEYVFGNDKIGSATTEVFLKNGDTWFQGHSLLSDRDYLVRGGIGRGMYYFGDISMDSPFIGTRVVLTSK